MKKHYFFTIAFSVVFLVSQFTNAQGTETFDNENAGSSSFSENNGLTFNITSSTGEDYDIFEDGFANSDTSPGSSDQCSNCGWNGTAFDQKFVDLTGINNNNGDGNGSSFTISSADGTDVTIKSLYLFCSTSAIGIHSGDLTITGKKDGNPIPVYEFVFSGTYANPTTFTPNNGFTFIDMASTDSVDHSNTNVDEITFTSSGNLDYMALDTFTWGALTLSNNDFRIANKPSLFPNPATETITISNLETTTSYSIINILGKTISAGSINNNDTINISKLSNGVYFIKLKTNEVIRFIKQ
ncbi:T9SS type A sorting domain-containing protein [Lacinutrix sp. Bg11-31]|uniref:T9SS type A sorting domain-containing protein n=1 Tax=Lacinutrix sp. Bg11-31 TaxID=2057808 RepID=UPI000C30C1BE|nr:T9SS type A sorting domain-containing protein [Lacinutrix sp. Bg11-31]AUC82095.1 hypothetical protein CW733_08130 [Lacinutrix sp. Bg11-31]